MNTNSKKVYDINFICPISWDKLTDIPGQKAKFCGKCEKRVHDHLNETQEGLGAHCGQIQLNRLGAIRHKSHVAKTAMMSMALLSLIGLDQEAKS